MAYSINNSLSKDFAPIKNNFDQTFIIKTRLFLTIGEKALP